MRKNSFIKRSIFKYYIPPILVNLPGYEYYGGCHSYSHYDYLQPNIASLIRTMHFEHALRLTKEYFYKANVIDFGCADGPFLPSLSKYFNSVVAIDKDRDFIKLATELINKMHLPNVNLICNDDLTFDTMKSKIHDHRYQILYLLETLEHIGDRANPWISRIDFVKDLFTLIDEKGIVVLSVPNMVGIPFLLQRLGLFLLRQQREPISLIDILRASFFSDTNRLEKKWVGGHLGFNHKRLEKYLCKDFKIIKKLNTCFFITYVLATPLA